MITTVIFDIGNVLVGFAWKEMYSSLGFSEEEMERTVKATIFHPAWAEYDRGVWTDEQVLQAFIDSDPEMEQQIRLTQKNVNGIVTRQDFAIPWIKELKEKGYRVLYLSNFSKKVKEECIETLDFLPYMDGGIMSYTIHSIKPEKEIYEELIRKYRLIPGECVFLDDVKENLDGAEKAGIHTIQVLNHEQAYEELNRFLQK